MSRIPADDALHAAFVFREYQYLVVLVWGTSWAISISLTLGSLLVLSLVNFSEKGHRPKSDYTLFSPS